MHDLFDILGLPVNAPASEVRRACARRPRRSHPDFNDGEGMAQRHLARATAAVRHDDAAIDFVEMTAILDRIQASFFGFAR